MSNRNNKKEDPKRKRVILGGFHAKMTIPEGLVPDTHVAYWHKDANGRLQQAEQAGYTYVTNKEGYQIGDGSTDSNNNIGSKVTIVADKSTGVLAYLMMKRKDWYEEDLAEKQKKPNMIDEAIHNVKGVGSENIYGDVKVENSRYKS